MDISIQYLTQALVYTALFVLVAHNVIPLILNFLFIQKPKTQFDLHCQTTLPQPLRHKLMAWIEQMRAICRWFVNNSLKSDKRTFFISCKMHHEASNQTVGPKFALLLFFSFVYHLFVCGVRVAF